MAALGDPAVLEKIQSQIWQARLPLEITLSASESRHYDRTEPYLISVPRLTYLPLLIPRLQNFYQDSFIVDPNTISPATDVYFIHDGVPLKPHLPIGLLYDIHVLSTSDLSISAATPSFSSHDNDRHAVPFRITLHFSPPSNLNLNINTMPAFSPTQLHDAFINSTKEADFVRSGSAKPIMSLSAIDSQDLWTSTVNNDLNTFSRIFASLLPGTSTSTTPWRNVPLRVYLPAVAAVPTEEGAETQQIDSGKTENAANVENSNNDKSPPARGQVRVLQSQIPPYMSGSGVTSIGSTTSHLRGQVSNVPQTLGMALHTLLPSLFPSRRTPILAKPLLHGTVVPMNASLEDLARRACYADGWVNVVVSVTG